MKLSCTSENLNRSTLIGILFTIVLGTLLHFTYDWSGKMVIVSFFSAVNESTWEHLKLLFMPMFLYSTGESILLRGCFPGLFKARALGSLAGMFLITAVFYTYTGILGRNYFPLDIAAFLIGVTGAFLLSTRAVKDEKKRPDSKASFPGGLAIFLLIFLCFVWFTGYPPQLGLFEAPV